MKRTRVIAELDTAEEARRVEESVKTGYLDSTIESLTQWRAVEEDLAESYAGLAQSSKDEKTRERFMSLHEGSRRAAPQITQLLTSLEELDRARVERIGVLSKMGS